MNYCSFSGNDLGKSRIYDYGFRDYSPISMRFTTVDPIKDGLNWYAYVKNDPINYFDPYGLCSESDNTFWQTNGNAIGVIAVGTAMTIGSGYVIVQSGGTATPALGSSFVMGIQLVGLGVGMLTDDNITTRDVILATTTPVVLGLEGLND